MPPSLLLIWLGLGGDVEEAGGLVVIIVSNWSRTSDLSINSTSLHRLALKTPFRVVNDVTMNKVGEYVYLLLLIILINSIYCKIISLF